MAKLDFNLTETYGSVFNNSISRISSNPSVTGIVVAANRGNVVYSNVDNHKTYVYSNKIWDYVNMVRSTVRQADPDDDLNVVRIKTQGEEIICVVATHESFLFAVQQLEIKKKIDEDSDVS